MDKSTISLEDKKLREAQVKDLNYEQKILSIVYFGRNDDYAKDWIKRFEYIFNYNFHVLNELGFSNKVEFHIVDFVCDKKIIDDLRIVNNKSQVNIHQVYDDNGKLLMNQSKALNIGINKSSCEYVLLFGGDTFVAPTSWSNLFNLLENKNKYFPFSNEYMLIPRKQFPKEFDYRDINYNQLDKICKYNLFSNFKHRNNKAHVGAGSGGVLLSKETFDDLKGFDESFKGYGEIDAEFMDRLSKHHDHLDLINYGIYSYKLPYSKSGNKKNIVKESIVEEDSILDWRFPERKKDSGAWASGDIKSFIVSNNNKDNYDPVKPHITIKIDLGLMKIKHLLSFPLHSKTLRKKVFKDWKKVHILSQIRENYKIIDIIADVDLAFLFCPVIGFKNSMSSIYIIDADLDANLDGVEERSNMVIRATMSKGNIGYARSIRTDIGSVKEALNKIETPLINPTIAVNSKTNVSKVIFESELMKKARIIMVVGPKNNELLSSINKEDFPNHIELEKIHLYSKDKFDISKGFSKINETIIVFILLNISLYYFLKDILMYLRSNVLKKVYIRVFPRV